MVTAGQRRALFEHKERPLFANCQDIGIAADDAVSYQNLVATIDSAVAAGFADVGVTDSMRLSAQRRR